MIEVKYYSRAFVELKEIIKYFDNDIKNKIPDELKQAINQVKQNGYHFVYNEKIPLYGQEILPETKSLLSILYSDYLCSVEEKKKWNEYDFFEQQLESKKLENKKYEQYNIDDVFKNRKTEFDNQMLEKQAKNLEMVEYKEPKWHQKLLKKLLKIFRKNKI